MEQSADLKILRESEERLRIAIEAAQIYTWEVDEAAQTIKHSSNAVQVLGFEPPQDYAAKTALIHPDDRTAMALAAECAVHNGKKFSGEYRVINPDNGEIIWIRSQGIHTGTGTARRFIGVTQNITERKRFELNAAFLAEIGDDFSRLCGAADIMREVGRKVCRHLGITRLDFFAINEEADEVTAIFDVSTDKIGSGNPGAAKISDFITPEYRNELKAGKTIAVNDVETDARTAAYAAAYRPYRVRAHIISPYLRDGRWKFILCAERSEPYRWRKDEVELMHELTGRIYVRLERAYAEEALRASEEEFRTTFEFSSVGKAQADPITGCLLRVNQKLCEITLYSSAELIGKSISELTHPLDREKNNELFRQMVAGEITQFDIEKRYLRKDGSAIWVCVSVNLLRDVSGKPARAIAVIQDISARKHAEEALETELIDMQRLQETSTRLIPEGKIDALLNEILNTAITVTRADKGTLQLLDIETNELAILASRGFTRPFVDFFDRTAKDKNSVCGRALHAMKRIVISDVRTENSETAAILRNSGIHSVQATPLVSRAGRILGMLSTYWREPRQPAERELRLLDVLARQAADLIERHQGEVALKKANRRKDEFLAMLGHELRNPLAPILTALHLMRLKKDNEVERERNVIERQVNHLVRLVDDLLDVSRITSGKIELKKQWVELSTVVSRALEMVSPLLEQRQHNLILKVAPTGFRMYVDVERLAQTVSNLLTNAAKYTNTGGKITVSARHRKKSIELSVQDSGVGIDPQLLPHIFDLFSQGPQPLDRSTGGLGLGLAIVRSLVTLHDGRIEARSDGPG
ncbi:MAG TPA: PAS domain S-box protein, partial [Gammaproteobacteria bacterium]